VVEAASTARSPQPPDDASESLCRPPHVPPALVGVPLDVELRNGASQFGYEIRTEEADPDSPPRRNRHEERRRLEPGRSRLGDGRGESPKSTCFAGSAPNLAMVSCWLEIRAAMSSGARGFCAISPSTSARPNQSVRIARSTTPPRTNNASNATRATFTCTTLPNESAAHSATSPSALQQLIVRGTQLTGRWPRRIHIGG
jgi:hypothetical protein